MTRDLLYVAAECVELARKAGATAADAVAVSSSSEEVTLRNGTIENVERSESQDVGLRVFIGQSAGLISGSVLSRDGLQKLVGRAIAMARLAPPDPYAGLAEAHQLAESFPDLDLVSSRKLSSAELQELARRAEATALAVEGVTRSNGASSGTSARDMAVVASNGFSRRSQRTSFGISASVVAGEGTAMERDGDGHSAIHFEDLESAEKIGRTAGERAVARLNPRKIASQTAPILFDRRIATSLVGHLLGAINGSAIARGTSFLKNDLGRALFRPDITILDDPLRRRGLASRPVDGEGLPTRRMKIIDSGVLTTWILDLRSARQLGLAPTGHGARALASPPSPSTSNVHMEAGARAPGDMMKDFKRGLLVTEFIGSSINMVTGDYSRGCSGFWIENGEISYPVSEVTVAGNLRNMFAALEPANDLLFRGAVNAPSCFLGEMTIAGR
jgi:PmbA protein